MKRTSLCLLGLLPAAVLFLASCSKDIQNQEAVRQGVLDYLKERTSQIGIDMNNIDVKVTSVSFEQNVARTSVQFLPKNGPANGGMSMSYVLDRKNDKWVVRGRQSDPANPHGGGQALPGNQTGPGSDGAPAGQLPPGHPGVNGQAPGGQLPPGQLPPGHPGVGTPQ